MADYPNRKAPAWITPDGNWVVCRLDGGMPLPEEAWQIKTGCSPRPMSAKGFRMLDEAKARLSGDPLWQEACEHYYNAVHALCREGYIAMEFDHDNPETFRLQFQKGDNPMTSEQVKVFDAMGIGIPKSQWRPMYRPGAYFFTFRCDEKLMQTFFPGEWAEMLEWRKKKETDEKHRRRLLSQLGGLI